MQLLGIGVRQAAGAAKPGGDRLAMMQRRRGMRKTPGVAHRRTAASPHRNAARRAAEAGPLPGRMLRISMNPPACLGAADDLGAGARKAGRLQACQVACAPRVLGISSHVGTADEDQHHDVVGGGDACPPLGVPGETEHGFGLRVEGVRSEDADPLPVRRTDLREIDRSVRLRSDPVRQLPADVRVFGRTACGQRGHGEGGTRGAGASAVPGSGAAGRRSVRHGEDHDRNRSWRAPCLRKQLCFR